MTTATEPRVVAALAERLRAVAIPLLAAAMAALAVVLVAPGLLDDPAAAVPDLRWLALLPLFAAAEVVVIHLPTHRNAHGHTLREIPAVLGLTFLAPQQYVSAYVLGAVLALLVAARMRGVKLVFNAAMFALEAALGVLVYHAIVQGGDPLAWTGWLAVLVAVLVTDLISAAAVTAAISLTEGEYDGEVLREALRSGIVAAVINTCVALLVATLVLVQPSALPLLGVLVVVLVLGYRLYIALIRGHARTQLLYRFVDRTSTARSLQEVIEVVLREAAGLMHAERAYLLEVLDDRTGRCHAFEDGSLRVEPLAAPGPGTWWWAALDSGVVQHPARRADDAQVETLSGAVLTTARDGLAAALRGAGPVRYVLVALDRSFEKETFAAEDVQVFEALAAHAGVAVERARSVTELQTLAAELEVARDAALAASEAKSMFLANVSHEIRTPLSTVLAAGELLEDSPLDPAQGKLLGQMRRSGDVLLSLVEKLLDFSRIDAGQADLEASEFDLRALVHEVAETHAPQARSRGLAFVCAADPCAPGTLTGDRARLLQVLHNLVDNAVKFTTDGEVRLGVRADEQAGVVELWVSDTGIGIDPADRDVIFDAFTQVDGSTTRRYEGTGLGLAICRQLTELMGGSIGVSGEPGGGSTFTVRLPLTTPAPTA